MLTIPQLTRTVGSAARGGIPEAVASSQPMAHVPRVLTEVRLQRSWNLGIMLYLTLDLQLPALLPAIYLHLLRVASKPTVGLSL